MASKVRVQHRVRILEKLMEVGEATCHELEKMLNMIHQTASARIAELKQSKTIIDTGKKRFTQNKRLAAVYKVNEVEKWPGIQLNHKTPQR